jgi:hypothetical protein
MHWQTLQGMGSDKFKRLVGVKRETFDQMVKVLRSKPKTSQHRFKGSLRGPKPKLIVEDQLLMMLMYYREYRPFLHVGASFGVSEAQCWRVVRDLEERLIKSGEFSLTRKQALASDFEFQVVVADVSEHPIERPKKSNAATTQGKRNATLSRAKSSSI